MEKKKEDPEALLDEGKRRVSPSKNVEEGAVDGDGTKSTAPCAPLVVKDTSDKTDVDEETQDGAPETEKQDTSEAERPTTPAQQWKRRSRSRRSKDLRKIRQLDIASAAPSPAPVVIPYPLLVQNLADELRSRETPPLNSAQAYLMQLQLAPHLAMVSPLSPFATGGLVFWVCGRYHSWEPGSRTFAAERYCCRRRARRCTPALISSA